MFILQIYYLYLIIDICVVTSPFSAVCKTVFSSYDTYFAFYTFYTFYKSKNTLIINNLLKYKVSTIVEIL